MITRIADIIADIVEANSVLQQSEDVQNCMYLTTICPFVTSITALDGRSLPTVKLRVAPIYTLDPVRVMRGSSHELAALELQLVMAKLKTMADIYKDGQFRLIEFQIWCAVCPI